MLFLTTLIACLLTRLVFGNVEKAILVAPDATTLPADASIDNLLLISLNPKHLDVRTYLNASFPTDENPKGTETWLLLEDLNPGQRYEVRICWLATQPTTFWLYTHSISDAFETPSLISSLTSHAYKHHAVLNQAQIQGLRTRRPKYNLPKSQSSLLFLQIYAAAEYYSLREELMTNVPPVHVDIILDPYLLNIFPQSLVPTALYITLIAIGAWFLSAWIAARLRRISTSPAERQLTPIKEKREKSL